MTLSTKTKSMLCAVVFSAAGCATAHTISPERLADSEAAIRAAREAGAEDVPKARLHLQLAREQIDEAKRLIESGEDTRADLMLLRAKADAELALTTSREEAMKREAQQALDQVRAMQDESAARSIKKRSTVGEIVRG